MTRETSEDRLAALDGAFPQFVAALWRRAGWTVEPENEGGVVAQDEGVVAFTARTDDGRRSTRLHPVPPAEGTVTAGTMRDLVGDSVAVDAGLTAVSANEFTTGALDVADAHGVDAVGPVAVARLVDALDAADLFDDPSS